MKIFLPVLFFLHFSITFGQIITSFDPFSGNVGSIVNIYGRGFNTDYTKNTVFFGGVKATIVSGSSSQLTVKVPAGSNFQLISVVNLDLKTIAYSNKPFITTFITNNIIQLGPAYGFSALSSNNGLIASVTGDLDGDGKTEIVTSIVDNSIYKINILRNTSTPGSVSFDESFTISLAANPITAAIGDLNGDGKLDLAIRFSNKITIFINTSTLGSLSFQSGLDINNVGGDGNQLIIRDIGGYYTYTTAGVITNPSRTEGHADLITFGGNKIKYIDNISSNGNLAFATPVDVDMFFSNSNNITRIDITDIDNDGVPDFIADNGSESRVRINLGLYINEDNNQRGSIYFTVANVSTLLPAVNQYIISDIDGDDKLDLNNWSPSNSNILSVYRSQSSKQFLSFLSPLSANIDIGSDGSKAMAINDLSGDGKPDYMFIKQTLDGSPFNPSRKYYISTLINNSVIGTILFANNNSDFFFTGIPNPTASSLTTADIDGDGKTDVVTSVVFEPNAGNVISTVQVSLNLTAPLAPIISSFSPTEGASAGNFITIFGSNFTEVTQIKIGSTIIPATNYVINSLNQVTIEIPANASSGKIEITNRGGVATSVTDFVTIDPAGLISGNTNICQGSKGVKYSVPAVAGAAGYDWVLPTGVTIVSGQNTKDIVVDFSGTLSGSSNIKVRGINTSYKGSFSPSYGFSILLIPETPGNVTANVVYANSISLTWEDKSANETDFYIYRAKGVDSSFVLLDKRTKDITTFSDNFDLQVNTTYYYKIAASNNDCLSPFSTTVGITTPPATITAITVASEEEAIPAPNPNDGVFSVILPAGPQDKVILEMTDILGKKLNYLNRTSNGNRHDFDINNYPSGIYILTIEAGGKKMIRKIVKN